MISVFIVEEYRNKTINLLFTYPVQRGKLIAVKIILICGVMLLFHVLSGVFQFTCLSVVSKYFPFVTVSPANLMTQAVTALSSVLLGLLPLYIGMIKKSTFLLFKNRKSTPTTVTQMPTINETIEISCIVSAPGTGIKLGMGKFI